MRSDGVLNGCVVYSPASALEVAHMALGERISGVDPDLLITPEVGRLEILEGQSFVLQDHLSNTKGHREPPDLGL